MFGSKSSPPSNDRVAAGLPVDQPLSLTVHSLPDAGAASVQQTGNSRTAKLKFFFLLLVSLAPVLASYFTYYVIRPEGRRNYGELIDPQRGMPSISGVDLLGQTVQISALKDQWLLISVADSACDQVCEQHLYLSRQLRESLGKDKDRLDRVWFRIGEEAVPVKLQPGLIGATVIQMSEADISTWLQPALGQKLSDHLYVVDPMGNWMMRFPANAEVPRVRKDLERLMRGSAFWDIAGRP